MDPVGPWSAYAQYNRLTGVQAGAPSGELHPHLPGGGTTSTPPSTTAQLLSTGLLSPPTAYEVFTPFFHHANAKPPAHYVTQVTQHRQVLAAAAATTSNPKPETQTGDYQGQTFFEQGAATWGQNSPFGILPHESVPATGTPTPTHFTAQGINHLSAQLKCARAQSPQATKTPSQVQTAAFFQVPSTFPSTDTPTTLQSCIVTSPSNRVPVRTGTVFLSTTPRPPSATLKQPLAQVQTKAQSKHYPERSEESNTSSNFPMDVPGRVNYTGSNASGKRAFPPTYRHYPSADEFRKTSTDYTNGGDCNVVVPRRPSPLVSQSTPLGHTSPAYPMYNSTMNQNHVTPIDVSVPRASAPGVAYPSVITRALNSEKGFAERYERQVPSSCWEERQRKFPQNYSTNTQTIERQNYLDGQVPLQDLSSCRGDPMSIVKNLQQQQQVCQIQETKTETKPTKRRKSNEKTNENQEYFSRIPPPAHTAAAGQQNGTTAYFDFDRWNLPPGKIFPAQTIQQQTIGVPHHSGHPLPYFPPFLAAHPGEFQSEVSTGYQEANTSQYQPEEQPKVVVPNIEEELNFLSIGAATVTQNKKPATKAKPAESNSGSGFMSSYLKFLQGERDNSPPPSTRNTRKQTWVKTKTTISEKTNGASKTPPPTPTTTKTCQGDPQDDPRYFPLPKERKKNCFNSSDDGFSSGDDLFTRKVTAIAKSESKVRKGRPPKSTGLSEKKRTKKTTKLKEPPIRVERSFSPSDVAALPRRESSKRAAKDKVNLQLMEKDGDDDLEEPPEFIDSDSDPAWTPQIKDEPEEEVMMKKSKRGRLPRKRAIRNLIGAAAKGAGIQEVDGYISDSVPSYNKKQKIGDKKSFTKQKQTSTAPTLEDNIAAAVAQQNSVNPTVNLGEDNPYKNGEFLVVKEELNVPWPVIWKVDGRSILQKYEPFKEDDKTFYRNVSSYITWRSEYKKQYVPVPVKLISHSQHGTIVEFFRDEMLILNNEFMKKVMKESESYQDNFEVYIQTLISQALDSNFLTEIFQEKDDYFLTNVKTIDEITNSKWEKMLSVLKWPKSLCMAVSTWPCFNVLLEVNSTDAETKTCSACLRVGVDVRVLMYGQPYNSTTLDGSQPDPEVVNEKDFLMCRMCASRIELLNKIIHQKYLMYIECAKRVTEKRTKNPEKDTTCILNELLADEKWLIQLFVEVRNSWAEVDSLENSYEIRNKAIVN